MPDPTTEDQKAVAQASQEAGIADETAAYETAVEKAAADGTAPQGDDAGKAG